MKQNNKNVEEFYHECTEVLADLNAKVMLDPGLSTAAKAVMSGYEGMLTRAYVDGLHEPISSLTRTSRPATLLDAFQHALEHENAAKRKRANNSQNSFINRISQPNGNWRPNFPYRPDNAQRQISGTPFHRQSNPANRAYTLQNTVQQTQRLPAIKQEMPSSANFRRQNNNVNFHEQNSQQTLENNQEEFNEQNQEVEVEDLNFRLPVEPVSTE